MQSAKPHITRSAAEAMVPGQSPDDYSFVWGNSADIDLDVLQDMNEVAAEAAFEVGASPAYAKVTVAGLETMLTQSSGIEKRKI